jgi:hypothetical protein
MNIISVLLLAYLTMCGIIGSVVCLLPYFKAKRDMERARKYLIAKANKQRFHYRG